MKKQKEEKINQYNEENKKLGKGDKNFKKKIMNKREYSDNIDKNRNFVIEHYDKKIKEIEEIGHEKFILEVLNKEKNDNIRRLMFTNLNSNFTLNDNSTDASVHLDNKIQE